MTQLFTPGDSQRPLEEHCIITPTERIGSIQKPPWPLLGHSFVQIERAIPEPFSPVT